MIHNRIDSKTKALIILEGLRGRLIADICNEHQISQTQYYRRRTSTVRNRIRCPGPTNFEDLINGEHYTTQPTQWFRNDDNWLYIAGIKTYSLAMPMATY